MTARPPSRSARRSSVLLAGAAAILPCAALSAHAPAAAAAVTQPQPGFAPAQGPLLLTRTLRRTLPDGKEVITRRTYEVRIEPLADGWRVDGRQIDCTVEAPPSLRALAAIEQARHDNGMFPILLDAGGMIVELGKSDNGADTAPAAQTAAALLDSPRLSAADRGAALGFVRQMQASAASGERTVWPRDLFRPAPGQRMETSALALPDGSQGRVTVSVDSSTLPAEGERIIRTVVTEAGGTRRVTQEEWTLVRRRS